MSVKAPRCHLKKNILRKLARDAGMREHSYCSSGQLDQLQIVLGPVDRMYLESHPHFFSARAVSSNGSVFRPLCRTKSPFPS